MNLFIDIETIPQQPELEAKAEIAKNIQAPAQMSKPETIAAWHAGEGSYAGVKESLIEETYRKTSFDGGKGEIISVAFAGMEGPVLKCHRGMFAEESEMLEAVKFELLSMLGGKAPWFIGHNIGGFDLKFLFQRFVINRVNPQIDFKHWGRHGSQYYDTMQAWAGYGNRVSQDSLCKALGIEGKPEGIDGSKVWDFYKAGKIVEIADYNADDVEKVRAIYKRMNFMN